MRVKIYFTLLLSLFFFSCQQEELREDPAKDNPDWPEWVTEPVGLMMHGDDCGKVSLYCLEKNHGSYGELWYEYYPSIKTLTRYADMQLCMKFEPTPGNCEMNQAIYNALQMEADEICKQKSVFLQTLYFDYLKQPSPIVEWPMFYTACVNGDFTIFCDKTLFGQEPGTNLSVHFVVASCVALRTCLPVGWDSPKMAYNFGEEMPEGMDDIFLHESWLSDQYWLYLRDCPEEKHEEITFTIVCPVKREHVFEYVKDKHAGQAQQMRVTEDTFTSSCTIKFDWSKQ